MIRITCGFFSGLLSSISFSAYESNPHPEVSNSDDLRNVLLFISNVFPFFDCFSCSEDTKILFDIPKEPIFLSKKLYNHKKRNHPFG